MDPQTVAERVRAGDLRTAARLMRDIDDVAAVLADAFTEPKRDWPPIAEEKFVSNKPRQGHGQADGRHNENAFYFLKPCLFFF